MNKNLPYIMGAILIGVLTVGVAMADSRSWQSASQSYTQGPAVSPEVSTASVTNTRTALPNRIPTPATVRASAPTPHPLPSFPVRPTPVPFPTYTPRLATPQPTPFCLMPGDPVPANGAPVCQ
jgi:hypothetical protein